MTRRPMIQHSAIARASSCLFFRAALPFRVVLPFRVDLPFRAVLLLRVASLGAILTGIAGCTDESTASNAPVDRPAANAPAREIPIAAQSVAYGLEIQLESGDIAANQPDTARLFVYLREPGQRMPIAVTQFPAAAIPPSVQFELDRPYATVEAIARLSATGTVTAQPADLETQVTTAVTHPSTTVAMSLLNARAPRLAPTLAGSTTPAATEYAAPAIAAAEAAPAAPTKALNISVEFAIRGDIPATATVFVIAKAPDSPMPVAVKRLQFGDLPTVVTLTDADSMIATRRISTTKGLLVSAHISRSGNAGRQPGDWVGQGVQDPDNAENFTVTIDQPI